MPFAADALPQHPPSQHPTSTFAEARGCAVRVCSQFGSGGVSLINSFGGEFKTTQLSLTADRLDTGANWRVLAQSQAHHRSRLLLRTAMHLAPCTMPLSPHASSFTVCHATAAWRTLSNDRAALSSSISLWHSSRYKTLILTICAKRYISVLPEAAATPPSGRSHTAGGAV